jgi:hypothetical protein
VLRDTKIRATPLVLVPVACPRNTTSFVPVTNNGLGSLATVADSACENAGAQVIWGGR